MSKLEFISLRITGGIVQVAAYALLTPAGPFPMMCAAFGLGGFALALETSQCNSFVASFKEPATRLGFLHASYGMYRMHLLNSQELQLIASIWVRSWSIHEPTRRDTLCSTAALVVPLPHLTWYRREQRRVHCICIPLQVARWSVHAWLLLSSFIYADSDHMY